MVEALHGFGYEGRFCASHAFIGRQSFIWLLASSLDSRLPAAADGAETSMNATRVFGHVVPLLQPEEG